MKTKSGVFFHYPYFTIRGIILIKDTKAQKLQIKQERVPHSYSKDHYFFIKCNFFKPLNGLMKCHDTTVFLKEGIKICIKPSSLESE